jgi:RNA polymerase sigma-70 factor (ECF subfamily)
MAEGDRELLDRVLAGETEGFDAIVTRHGAPVWGALRRLLGNADDVREVFQETFLRAFERLDSLRDAARLRSWLVSIALNLARERLRGPRSTELAVDPGTELAVRADGGPPASAELERAEDAARVRAEVAALPPRQRQVVELRMDAELSHAEIALLLGISEESSRANFYQGMRRLKARLEDTRPDSREWS